MARTAAVAALALILAAPTGLEAWAQTAKPGEGEVAKLYVPDKHRLAILIQSVVVAVSQANLTGNYTVLHALGSPSFRQANSPQKLTEIFANMRANKIDLTPVIILTPFLVRDPVIDKNNMLHLTGFYKTEPLQVNFDLLFQPVAGQWRLFGVSIDAARPSSAAASPEPQPVADKKKAAPTKNKKQ